MRRTPRNYLLYIHCPYRADNADETLEILQFLGLTFSRELTGKSLQAGTASSQITQCREQIHSQNLILTLYAAIRYCSRTYPNTCPCSSTALQPQVQTSFRRPKDSHYLIIPFLSSASHQSRSFHVGDTITSPRSHLHIASQTLIWRACLLLLTHLATVLSGTVNNIHHHRPHHSVANFAFPHPSPPSTQPSTRSSAMTIVTMSTTHPPSTNLTRAPIHPPTSSLQHQYPPHHPPKPI